MLGDGSALAIAVTEFDVPEQPLFETVKVTGLFDASIVSV
jgi:hypothetical protein